MSGFFLFDFILSPVFLGTIKYYVTNTLDKTLNTCYHFQSDTFPVDAVCKNTGGIQ